MPSLAGALFASNAIWQTTSTPTAPGFQFLGFGYDILTGNPLDTRGVGDVGYKSNVFKFTTDKQRTTADGKWGIPDKTTAQEMPSCALNLTNQTINNTQSYHNALNFTFDITNETQYENESNPDLQKIAFAFNIDTRHVEQDVDVHNMTMVHESFTCSSYHLTMNLFDHPPFSDDFIAGLHFLPANYDESPYMMFISEFGTHVVTQLTSGGRWGWQTEFKYDDVERLKDDGIDFGLGLEVAAKIKAGFKIGVQKEVDQASQVINIIQNNASFNIGGNFTPDAAAWRESVKQYPMPVHQVLTPIADLLNPFLIEGIENLAQKRIALKSAMGKYCEYLRKNADKTMPLPSCNNVFPESSIVLV